MYFYQIKYCFYTQNDYMNKGILQQLVLTYFIDITDIYKQNNSNSTIGFRNEQMLFFKSVSYYNS